VAIYLEQTRGRHWSNLLPYGELTSPALFGLTLAVGVATESILPQNRVYILLTFTYLAVVAAVAWIGLLRHWPWWVRWVVYATATATLVVSLLGIAMTDDRFF
jgi:hypothetical protein